MCGIAGLFKFERIENKEEVKGLCINLLKDIETRGKDATGISFIDSQDNKIFVFKKNVCASDFIKLPEFNDLFFLIKNYNCILLHTRMATTGDKEKNVNNHPHYSKIGNNVLIHNGMLHNYEELKESFKLKMDGDCDSEVILSLFNYYKKMFQHENKIIKKTIGKLSGSFAIGLYDAKKLYLYKNDNPLKLCYNKDKNLFLFSSYYTIFKEMFIQKKKKHFNLFEENIKQDNFFIYDFDDEDLITIDFQNKNIKKQEGIKTDEYVYSVSWSDKKEEATATEKEKTLDSHAQTEYEKCLNCADYEEDYFKLLEKEEREKLAEIKQHNHRTHLNSYYDCWGY